MKGRIWAEINLNNLINNLKIIKSFSPNNNILAAVKADAYGHGSGIISKTLAEHDVNMLGVASVEEAIKLRDEGIKSEIVILSPIPEDQIPEVVAYNFTPTVFGNIIMKWLLKEAKKQDKVVKYHIEIDTGMGRTGLDIDEIYNFINEWHREPYLVNEGIFSHLSSADTDKDYTRFQIDTFKATITRLIKNGIRFKYIHIANSAGILEYKNDSFFNLIRPGLSLYGISPFEKDFGLKPVMSLYSKILQTRKIKKGSYISYNKTYKVEKDAWFVVGAFGYGDGYPRSLSNKAQVIIDNNLYPIRGVVCMDLTMIEVDKQFSPGTIITLIDEEELHIKKLSYLADLIPYEITTGISTRVPRIVKKRSFYE